MLDKLKNIGDKKYSYDELLVCSFGLKLANNDEKYYFVPDEVTPYIITRKLVNKEIYVDVLTNRRYKNFSNLLIWDKCIMEPIPLINVLEKESQEQLKNKGYVTRDDIINILSVLNDNEKENEKERNKKQKNEKILDIYDLTNLNFKSIPAIGREKELEEIMISLAQQTKNPIVVGESGVGKTAMFDLLAYMIQKGNVPKFLQNKRIYELNISTLLSDTKYRGEFDKKINNVIDYVIENDGYLLINEIHNIFSTGNVNGSSHDLADILKSAIDRDGLNVIGTTTIEEYDKYFKNDAIKRRFDKIIIEEPADVILERIIENVMIVFSEQSNIKLDNFTESEFYQIRQLLILLTDKKSRVYNDRINNPDLVIGIIDKMFALARMKDNDVLTIENIVDAIKSTPRIYESHREMVISELYKIKPKEKTKIIEFKR